MTADFLVNWLAMTPAFAVPLLAASVGLIVAERAGVVSLGAEGYMAMGAMCAAVTALLTDSLIAATFAGIGGGMVLALVFGVITIVLRADQILTGLAVVGLGLGITGVVGRPFVHQTFPGFAPIEWPQASGAVQLFARFLAQDVLVYLVLFLVILSGFLLSRTRFGLRLRAIGEDPATADIAGVPVHVYQFVAVLFSGAFCGLGGAYLSIAASDVWVEGMVAGRGWIALSLVIFARWNPYRAIAGAFLFGAAEALLPRLQAAGFDAPTYLMAMLPYVLTILVLIVAARWRLRGGSAPAVLGRAYLRQDRH